MATIFIDGEAYDATDGENLLQACLGAGVDLPYFCWHPAMGSVGACRQCAIVQYQDENDTRGRLTMACMTPASEGLRLSVKAPNAVSFRESVIESLMLNHPHDCPVCEEGGECHLQDMTVMSGHTFRRYAGRKRTFRNQYLGPFLNHEMNRCITCYRCVRFYKDYAGGDDLDAFGSRSRMFFGRVADGTLDSEFAGNLVEVCPTGVFTDKPFSETYTRKWDLQSAPSVCPGCAVGCNVLPAERYGRLKRVHNRYHSEINGYFLCDRGRFGAAFVNSEKRFPAAGVRTGDGSYQALTKQDAIDQLGTAIGSGDVIGIGSPRASVESNFALRQLVGTERFCNGMASREAALVEHALGILSNGPARSPTLKDVEQADAVLILGEDVSNTAPRLALALRQAARNEELDMAGSANIPLWQDAGVRGHAQGAKTPICSATITATRIDDIASEVRHLPPHRIAQLGFAIAALINADYPQSDELDPEDAAFAQAAADALSSAERPLIVSGTGVLDNSVLEAAANVAWALRNAGRTAALALNVPEANSLGAAMLGAGLGLDQALDMLADRSATTVIILENDLYRRAEGARVDAAFEAADTLVALDSLENGTVERADLVLPAATFAESEGTYVNYESRAQRFYQVYQPQGDVQPSWRWLVDGAVAAGRNDLGWTHIDALIASCAESIDSFHALSSVAPDAGFRTRANTRVPRQPHRYSGRTAMHADVDVHERRVPQDDQSPLAFSMEGANEGQPGSFMPYVWSPGWNSNQALWKFQQEIGGALKGGPAGVRLLDRATTLPDMMLFSPTPASPPPDTAFRALPLYEVFGSEELSNEAAAVQERIPAPYVVLNDQDAARLGVSAGDGVRVPNSSYQFQVRIDSDLAPGFAGFGTGLPGAWSDTPRVDVALERDPDYLPPAPAADLIARG